MNRSVKLISALAAFGLIAAALAVRAQTPKTQTVEFPSGKETVERVPRRSGQAGHLPRHASSSTNGGD